MTDDEAYTALVGVPLQEQHQRWQLEMLARMREAVLKNQCSIRLDRYGIESEFSGGGRTYDFSVQVWQKTSESVLRYDPRRRRS